MCSVDIKHSGPLLSWLWRVHWFYWAVKVLQPCTCTNVHPPFPQQPMQLTTQTTADHCSLIVTEQDVVESFQVHVFDCFQKYTCTSASQHIIELLPPVEHGTKYITSSLQVLLCFVSVISSN